MGAVRRYSELATVIKETGATTCVADTSSIISFIYEASEFEADSIAALKVLRANQISLLVNVSIRHEFLEYDRKDRITEFVLSKLSDPSISQYLPTNFKTTVGRLKYEVGRRAAADGDLPVMRDYEIKSLKRIAARIATPTGDLWTQLCRLAFGGTLQKSWDETVNRLGLNYVDFGGGLPSTMLSKPEWREVFNIVEKTAVGSSDAMIINFLECSKSPFALSCDFDLAYCALRNSTRKTILLPDALFERRIAPILQPSHRNRR